MAIFKCEYSLFVVFLVVLEYVSGNRPGRATNTHSCGTIRKVPSYLRLPRHMKPHGLTDFYQKYTEAYGIPVVGSKEVSDSALKRGCYVARFILAEHTGLRQSYYRNYGRFAIMAKNEVTTDIPEYAHLDKYYDERARGLGPTFGTSPVSTGAEENALCLEDDPYHREDIVLHEYAHGMHILAAKYAIVRFEKRLNSLYKSAKASGLWNGTYAQTDAVEYWAEGVQSYFNDEDFRYPSNGIHNHIDTRKKLKAYDPGLYRLIRKAFPCRNKFILRCNKNKSDEELRQEEQNQYLLMDCNKDGGYVGGGDTSTTGCTDDNEHCKIWSQEGHCDSNEFVKLNCKKSCKMCLVNETDECEDNSEHCHYWSTEGYCETNEYAMENCKNSCNLC